MILFKPNGTLDVSTDPPDLPEERDKFSISSDAMQRCKNLRMNQKGVLKTRDGSVKLNEVPMVGAPSLILNGVLWTGAEDTTPPTGWTELNTANYTVESDILKVTHNGDNLPWMYDPVALVIGETYRVSAKFKSGGGYGGAVQVGTTVNGFDLGYVSSVEGTVYYTDSNFKVLSFDFIATTETLYVQIYNALITSGTYNYWKHIYLHKLPMSFGYDFIIEEAGVRYVFTNEYIYKNEELITEGVNVETPTFSPAAGEYVTPQTVVITCDTVGSSIYYTLDGSDPTASSLPYPTSGVKVPGFCFLKAIGVKSGWVTSAIGSAYYSMADGAFITEYNLNNIITENSNQVITEGT